MMSALIYNVESNKSRKEAMNKKVCPNLWLGLYVQYWEKIKTFAMRKITMYAKPASW